MTISTIEESEIPEHNSIFTVVHARKPADAVGVTQLLAPGHHPKCRLVSVKAMPLVYANAVDVFAVEDGDGNDAATISAGAGIGISTTGTLIAGQVFERNESVNVNLTTDGDATNATLVFVQLESIH